MKSLNNVIGVPRKSKLKKSVPKFWMMTAALGLACGSVACRSGSKSPGVESAPKANSEALRAPQNADAIAHMFNFPFKTIEGELPALAEAGFGAIQISPPQLSNGNEWWGRYQPIDYRVISGPLGNEHDLLSLTAAAKKYHIRVIADVVFNHMANLGKEFDLTYPPRSQRETQGLGPLFTSADFNPAFCISNWDNPTEVRNGRICGGNGDAGLPDLNNNSPKVLQAQQDYLKKLSALGIDGFRVDAVKHMEPWYVNKLFSPEIVGNKQIYGEVIANEFTFDRDIEVYLRETRINYLDFPLQDTARRAFGFGGDLRTLVNGVTRKQALQGMRAVTFVINHDMPQNEGFKYMILSPEDEALAYPYLLGRLDGVPLVYSDLGRADGRNEDRWKNAHRSPRMAAMLKFRNKVWGFR